MLWLNKETKELLKKMDEDKLFYNGLKFSQRHVINRMNKYNFYSPDIQKKLNIIRELWINHNKRFN
jgi:hypothetical protein